MSTLTKVFIVLQLVFSIGLAVVVVMAVGADKDAKLNTKNAQIMAVAASAQVQQASNAANSAEQRLQVALNDSRKQIDDLNKDLGTKLTDLGTKQTTIDRLQGDVSDANANLGRVSAALASSQERLAAREKEVETMRPEFAKLREQNAQLVTANQQLQNQYDLAAKAIKTLQEAVAELKDRPEATPAKTGAAAAGSATVAQLFVGTQAPVAINGKITKVQSSGGQTFLTLALGGRDKVQEGTRFTLYRDNTYLGDAVVQKVTPDQSVALVNLVAKGQSIQVGDLAKSGD